MRQVKPACGRSHNFFRVEVLGLAARLEKHGLNASCGAFSAGRVGNVGLNLVDVSLKSLTCSWMMMVKGWKLTSSLRTLVHQSFDGLFVAAGFHLVQGCVNDLSIDALELAISSKIDLDVGVLRE